MSNIKNISKLVKEARINKGYSARELAKLCDISHTEINNIEKGERVRPAVLTLKAFEKYLDLDFKELATLVGYSKDTIEYGDNNIIVSYERYDKKVREFESAKQILLHEVNKKRHLGLDIKEYFDELIKLLENDNKMDNQTEKLINNINKLLESLIKEYDSSIENFILNDD